MLWRRSGQALSAAVALLIALPMAGANAEVAQPLEYVPDESAQDSAPDSISPFAEAVGSQASVIWEEDRGVLRVVLSASSSQEEVSELAHQYGVDSFAEFHQGEYTMDELMDVAESLVASGQANWAAPNPNLDRVDIGIPETVETPLRRMSPNDFGSEPVPINVVDVGDVEIASRDADRVPYIAGADMQRTVSQNKFKVCTTSFAIWGSTKSEMLTADHCSETGDVWRTGPTTFINTPQLGTFSSVAGADIPDIGVLRGKPYNAEVYYGPNTTASSVGIHGMHTPFVGATVCYSGAPSGTVCGNRVTHVNLYIDYGGWDRYGYMARTEQRSGQPAAGNGDSGGPVISVNSSSQALAAGVISGIIGGNSNCAGDPADEYRACSSIALYAPIGAYFRGASTASLMTYGSPFKDVPSGMQFAREMQWMKDAGVLEDPSTAYMRPLAGTTRGSMALFMYNMKGASFSQYSCFADVQAPTEENRAICWAKSRGISTGWSDNTFRPDRIVARDAMAAFLYRLAGRPSYSPPRVSPFTDVSTSNQFYKEIAWLAETGISTGWSDGSFRPLQPIARDAMSTFLYRMRTKGLA